MTSLEEAYRYIKENLSEERYIHTMGVISVAKKLAKINNVTEEKAEIAALCHDIAKNLSTDEMKKIIEENNIDISEDEKGTFQVWHGVIAPVLTKQKLKIDDEEILQAVRWHTTGKENMSTLDKIIYIADMIEPSRNFKGVNDIREETLKDLDNGVLVGLNHTIKYLLKHEEPIDVNSIKARNYLIKIQKGKNENKK